MNLIRLGDRIEAKQRPPALGEPYRTADNLSQRVFNASLEQEQIAEYYIQSPPPAARAAFFDDLPAGTSDLGTFETVIVGKLLNPPRPVLCIVGPLGCGKTTAKHYIALNLVKQRCHCDKCPQPHERLVAHIDFNEHIDLNDYTEEKLTQELYSLVCDELLGRLRTHRRLTHQEEFAKFWKYEYERWQGTGQESRAFRKISASLKDIRSIDSSSISDQEIAEREQILAQVEQDKKLYLDYLVRLWEYIIRVHYDGRHGCAFIIFDNIDRLAPVVQQKLVEIVNSSARLTGPTFVLFVRPETSDHRGLGTGIIDVEFHQGPTPVSVVLDRLKRFCEDPDGFFNPNDGLTVDQFNLLKAFLMRVQQSILTDSYQTFTKFLENSCGCSIRTALLVAQNLFRVSVAEMESPDTSLHDIVRTCVSGGQPQVKWENTDNIEHLFRLSGGEGRCLLVKPRILRYLGRHEMGRRRLNEIYNALSGFGYEEPALREALNDMMRANCQLIRSNGFDVYREEKALEKYGGHKVILTDIGQGYSEHLICDVNYVQEVMLDTYVDGDHFPKTIGYGYLSDKFRLVYQFLDELRRVDCEEMKRFIAKWGPPAYFETFGEHMISLDIIQGIYPSALRILNAAATRTPKYAHAFQEVVKQFKSLALKVESDNNDLLGIWVPSVVDTSERPAGSTLRS